jgi:hypothetical protein
MPETTATALHKCYRSPITPPIHAICRIGNVRWSEVRVELLLKLATCRAARFIWSRRLDSGSFVGVTTDYYEKDLMIAKAMQSEIPLPMG